MKKKIVQATVTAMLVSSMVVCPVFAEPSIDDLKDNKAAVEGEVTSLQSQLTSILDKINTLESDLSKKQEEIEKANVDLEEAIVQQQKQFADMKKRIQYMYEAGNGNELEILLSAENFSDLINKAEYIQNVHEYDKEKQAECEATTKKIEELSATLQEEAESLEKMQVQLEEDKTSLNTMIDGKQSEIAQLDASIQEAVAAQKAEEEKRQQEAAQAAAAQEAEENSNQSQQGNNSAGNENSNSGSNGGGSGSSSGGGNASIVPPQGTDGAAVVAYARQFLGNPYVLGGNSLTNGIDCSGFTQQIYAKFGVSLGMTDSSQAYAGVEVPLSQAQAGDLLVYYGHVGIYNGTGGIIHASAPGVGIVEWSDCTYRQIRSVRRVL